MRLASYAQISQPHPFLDVCCCNHFAAFALLIVSETEQRMNRSHNGGALDSYGLDLRCSIATSLNA